MTLYLDISLTKRHLGTPHGLARVEFSLSNCLTSLHPNLRTIWVDESWEVKVGGADEVHKLTDGRNSNRAAFENFSTIDRSASREFYQIRNLKEISRINRLVVLFSYLLSFFPSRVSRALWTITKKLYYMGRKFSPALLKLRRGAGSEQGLVRKRPNVPSFDDGDIILVAGNDWDRRIDNLISSPGMQSPRFAYVVYDLIPYEYPQFSVDMDTANRFTFWIGEIAQSASFLFFISSYSQERFNNMLSERGIASKAKQLVINLPPGLSFNSEVEEPSFCKEIKSGFFLVVSTIEARKNHKILISALKLAKSKNEPFPQLVFIGSPGWGTDHLVREINLDAEIMGNILLKSGVQDSELRWLFENCAAVLYPSVIEGFGLPVLESAIFKKPIITSDIKVFDEIDHPCRIKVNPYDSASWKSAIQSLTSDVVEVENTVWHQIDIPDWNSLTQKIMDFISSPKSS